MVATIKRVRSNRADWLKPYLGAVRWVWLVGGVLGVLVAAAAAPVVGWISTKASTEPLLPFWMVPLGVAALWMFSVAYVSDLLLGARRFHLLARPRAKDAADLGSRLLKASAAIAAAFGFLVAGYTSHPADVGDWSAWGMLSGGMVLGSAVGFVATRMRVARRVSDLLAG